MKSGRRFILTTLLCLGAAGVAPVPAAADDRCAKERAELNKIRTYELPARDRSVGQKEVELKAAVDESIALDQKIEIGKQMGAPARILDGYAKDSAALRKKIQGLKDDRVKRNAASQSFRQRAATLEDRVALGCPPEMLSKDDWQKAVGKWQNKSGSLVFELVDMNRVNREYYPSTEPIQVEGYIRKVPPTWPTDRVKPGDLIFIGHNVEGNVLSGGWICLPAKGECPKLPAEFSACTLTIDVASDTITSDVKTKQYWTPKCEWSNQVAPETFTFYRAK